MQEFPVAAWSLVWAERDLYDVSAGWLSIPAGTRRCDAYGERFDAAVASPRGDVVALADTTGTTALVLGADGRVVRELARSDDQAQEFRYPLALFTLPDGRTGLVHCPDEASLLVVEDALTGERLVTATGEDGDLYHSRLAVSAGGRFLLSAGWSWQPSDFLAVYDLHGALHGTGVLDPHRDVVRLSRVVEEVGGACFVGEDVVLTTWRGRQVTDEHPGTCSPGGRSTAATTSGSGGSTRRRVTSFRSGTTCSRCTATPACTTAARGS